MSWIRVCEPRGCVQAALRSPAERGDDVDLPPARPHDDFSLGRVRPVSIPRAEGAGRVREWRRRLRDGKPVVVRQLTGELTRGRCRPGADDEGVIRSRAHPPAHLGSHLDDVSFVAAARHGLDRQELGLRRASRHERTSRASGARSHRRLTVLELLVTAPQRLREPRAVRLAPHEHRLLAREATPPKPTPAFRKLPPMRGSRPMPRGDLADVGADLLADVRDLVDERDLGREEGVRRELDHLRGGDVGAHDRAPERLGERGDGVRRPRRRVSEPTTTRSGCMKSATAEPSFRNSGLEA